MKLKRGIAAILIGESIALRHKDDSFKTNIKQADGPINTMKVLFDGLFQFNKELVEDIKQNNFSELKQQAIRRFDKEKVLLEEKLTLWEKEYETRSNDKLPLYLMGLEDQYTNFEKKAVHRQEKLIDEYNLAHTLSMLKTRIDTVRKNLEDTPKETA